MGECLCKMPPDFKVPDLFGPLLLFNMVRYCLSYSLISGFHFAQNVSYVLPFLSYFIYLTRHTEVWLNVGHQTQRGLPTSHLPHWRVLKVEGWELQTHGGRGYSC